MLDIDNNYGWSTHKPLLKSLLDIHRPTLILELGIGLHSTKLFTEYNPHFLISIENDHEWLSEYCNNNEIRSNHLTLLHKLNNGLSKKSFLRDLTDIQKKEIEEYYDTVYKLADGLSNWGYYNKLLFVDNFTCCRNIAINTLFSKFNIIVYHDSEAPDWYEYDFCDRLMSIYSKYSLITKSASTSCFIRKNIDKEADLTINIQDHIDQYCIENNLDRNSIYLIKER
jgi:hypothetical protein